jgi:hypothetical protein
VRRDDAEELARRDYRGLLPEPRKVPLVARHQIVGSGGIWAFQEYVVIGVLRHLEITRRDDQMRMMPDQIDKLTLEALANLN